MKFQTTTSPLLLLLLPSLASALAAKIPAAGANDQVGSISGEPASLKGRIGVPTKDAPVDGKDGKPHLGPFVETEAAKSDRQELPQLKGRPNDLTVVDGKKIPESNDGIMFDKNRVHPQEGTTGTEGGVSEKDKARKAHEGKTGEKALTQPEAPKAQPPLPHSEEQKLKPDQVKDLDAVQDKSKSSSNEESNTGYTGLDVCHTFIPDTMVCDLVY